MFKRSFSSFVKLKTCDGKSWAAAKRFAANVITVSHQSRLWRKLPNTTSQRNKDTEWTINLLANCNSFINLTTWVYRDDYRLLRHSQDPGEVWQWRNITFYASAYLWLFTSCKKWMSSRISQCIMNKHYIIKWVYFLIFQV